MIYGTTGREIYKGEQFLIEVKRDNIISLACDDAFKLVFIESEAGVIDYKSHLVSFVGPCFCCINEHEQPKIKFNKEGRLTVITFHPSFINNKLSFDCLRDNKRDKGIEDDSERFWLQPFLQRDHFQGLIGLNELYTERINFLFNQIEEVLESQSDWYWPCRSRSFFIEVLFILERAFIGAPKIIDQKIPKEDPVYDGLCQYLTEHYMDKITLEQLTKEFGLNRTTLNQVFKEHSGQTALQYLQEVRLKTAASLLKNTAIMINEIIYRVGYQDKAHFNRHFKKIFQMSPSEYRNAKTWMTV